MTISVSLDIAGFYYFRPGIIVPNDATVRQVMDEANRLDLADMDAGMKKPVLEYRADLDGDQYIQSITIHHFAPAKSRQRLPDGTSPRLYAVGEYSFRSDGVKKTEDKKAHPYKPLTALDIVGSEIHRPATVTWQYYIYDPNGVDEARRSDSTDGREKIAFTESNKRKNRLSDGGTIVWRAVVIMIAPTRPKSMKAVAAAM